MVKQPVVRADVVRAKTIELVNDDGNTRALIGNHGGLTGIGILAPNESEEEGPAATAILAIDDKGEPMLTLTSRSGERIIRAEVRILDGEPSLLLSDGQGNKRAVLVSGTESIPPEA
jgi:hypothetical protein